MHTLKNTPPVKKGDIIKHVRNMDVCYEVMRMTPDTSGNVVKFNIELAVMFMGYGSAGDGWCVIRGVPYFCTANLSLSDLQSWLICDNPQARLKRYEHWTPAA